jgi:hypothetical protein
MMSRLYGDVNIAALCVKMGGRTKIRAHHGWPFPWVRQSIERDVSDAGEQRIGHFGQNRTLHSSMEE